ncbi:hypothetical protein [Halomonas sp. BC04]|uniref:hypothetical protein n=1 Tax=Halomonas sp. BC04 TaxID=1403540 RepID=UPI0012DF8F60|nr:hypothetical protein [Halomonas sp. BC04]
MKTLSEAAVEAAIALSGIGEGTEDIKTLDAAAVGAALSVANIGGSGAGINVLSADLSDTSEFVMGLDGRLIEVNKTISTMGTVAEMTGDQIEKSTAQLTELEKVAMELASNERIAAMEFTANIAVAGLELTPARWSPSWEPPATLSPV